MVSYCTFNVPRNIALGIVGSSNLLLCEGLSMRFPISPAQLHQMPLEISIARVVGTASNAHKFYETFGNITHTEKMIMGISYHDVPSVNQIHDAGLRHSLAHLPMKKTMAFVLDRPILTQIGIQAETPACRIDSFGDNDGKDVEVPESARMAIAENVHMMCHRPPVWTNDYDPDNIHQFFRTIPSGFVYDNLVRQARNRRLYQDHRERAAEEARVKAYADNNKDLSAWEEAKVDLDDPSTYPVPETRRHFGDNPEPLAPRPSDPPKIGPKPHLL